MAGSEEFSVARAHSGVPPYPSFLDDGVAGDGLIWTPVVHIRIRGFLGFYRESKVSKIMIFVF